MDPPAAMLDSRELGVPGGYGHQNTIILNLRTAQMVPLRWENPILDAEKHNLFKLHGLPSCNPALPGEI